MYYVCVCIQGKVISVYAMTTHRESTSTVPLILNLGATLGWIGQNHASAAFRPQHPPPPPNSHRTDLKEIGWASLWIYIFKKTRKMINMYMEGSL
jgi:hypothetical protein